VGARVERAGGDPAAPRTLIALYNLGAQAYAAVVPLTEQQLAEDLNRAMKARDMPRVYVLRGVVAAAKNLKVDKHGATLEEADLIQIVRREIRKREEAEEFAAKAGRTDVIEQSRAEREMLNAYAPAALSATDLEPIIRAIAAEPGGGSLGAIMGALKARHAGRFDGKIASDQARRVLADQASAS
jgi:uncharacterized protein YqeY